MNISASIRPSTLFCCPLMEYKPFDKIFAKVKGYPAWPARVSIFEGSLAGQPSKLIFDI